VGVFTAATVASLLATCPITVSVSLSPEPHGVVVGQADTPNPVCVTRR